MCNIEIQNCIDKIEGELEKPFEVNVFKTVLSQMVEVERVFSSTILREGSHNFIIEALYLNVTPNDCCKGCVRVPPLYTAFTRHVDAKVESNLDEFDSTTLNEIRGNIVEYLKILQDEIS